MSEYTSLANIPGQYEDDQAAFTWDFDLPPSVDTERIELNVLKIKQIQKIAHFSSSHVIGYQGETTQITPGINGINNNGTATASRSISVIKAQTQKSNLEDEFNDARFMLSHGTTETTHRLNKAEIVARVVDLKSQKGIDSNHAWAKELNTVLNDSIRSAAKAHLLRGNKPRRMLSYLMYGQGIGYTAIEQDPAHIGFVLGLKTMFTGLDIAWTKFHYGETMLQERRWTLDLYDASQPEKYFAVNALSRIGNTIRLAK